MPSSEPHYDFLEPAKREGEIGRLGPYRVLKLLGRGGMGQVFQAVDSRLKRNVALKVMTSRFASAKHSRRRFLEEARSMAAIHHENVVLVFEVGEKNDTPFLAMEMLKGKSLFQRRKEGWMFSDEEIIELGKQVSRGLAAAHECGIVHRDIKPGNIWIEEPSGRVKILDFGLAVAGEGVDRFSGRGSVVGSPGYLSPEQARDDPVDDRTDLYSLGVVLYELCVSRLPLVATTMPGQLIAILTHEPTPIRELNPDVKPELADVIHCLLSKEPLDRPNDAAHLEEMLEYAAQAPAVTLEPAATQDLEEETVAPVAKVVAPAINVVAKPAARSAAKPSVAPKQSVAPLVSKKSGVTKTKPRGKSKPLETASARKDRSNAGGSAAKRRFPLVVATLVALVAIPLAGYLIWRPSVRSNTPLPEKIVSKPKKAFKVLADSLKPFQLGDVGADKTEVKLGNALQFTVVISNAAVDGVSDPRVINSKAKSIALLATFAKQAQGEKLVGQRRVRPREMPGPGSEKTFSVSFLTTNLTAGPCNVLFRLQSPDKQTISEVSQQITIQE